MQKNETDNTDTVGETLSKMKITIGSQVFNATLSNNVTVKAFKALLPMTIVMTELNGNEKIFYFFTHLPVNAASGYHEDPYRPGT